MQFKSLKMFIGAFLLLGTTVGSALAVSPAGNWYAYRNNTGGTSSATMSYTSNSFCFLDRVRFTELDTGGEIADCHITPQNGRWILQAYMGTSSDADIRCEARCYYR